MEGGNIKRKIIILLILLTTIVSVVSVSANEEYTSEELKLTSHDFTDFKMNIPESKANITEKQGDANQTIYEIPNTDLSDWAIVEYWDSSDTNGNNNTTDFVLKKIKTNHTVDFKDGIYSWDAEQELGVGMQGYLVSSDDNSKVIVLTSNFPNKQDAVNSVEFK